MQAAILGMLVVNVPLLLVSFGMGYASRFDWMSVSVSAHLKVGLLAAFLTVLTQTTTMFYFMGTGSAIKSEVRERGLNPEFIARARAFKGSFFYLLTFGILLIMGRGDARWRRARRPAVERRRRGPHVLSDPARGPGDPESSGEYDRIRPHPFLYPEEQPAAGRRGKYPGRGARVDFHVGEQRVSIKCRIERAAARLR